MTFGEIQKHFVTPLSQAQVSQYQARLDIIQRIDWKHGAYYAIGDANELPGSYPLFECRIENGEVYLGEENACGEIDEFKPVCFVVYQGCRIILQR